MPVQSKSLRAQITWHTKWVEKSSEKVHKYMKKACLEHRLEKTWKKVAQVLKMCQKCVKSGVQKGELIFAFCPLAPPVAALAPMEFLMQKVLSKSSQNDDEIAKVTPKDTPWT